jgi:hypothetical protein
MTVSSEQLEQQLCEHYRRQLRQYALAIDIAERLPRELGESLVNDESLLRLGSILDNVANADLAVRGIKQEWESRQLQAGVELRDVLHDVEIRLKQLIGQIQVSEEVAQACKDRMRPQFHSEALTQRMRDAYANTVNHV